MELSSRSSPAALFAARALQGQWVIGWDEDGVSIFLAFRDIHVSNSAAAIIIGCIIYLVGGALQTGAMNLNDLWAGRWIAGLGVGFLVMIVPIYQLVFRLISSGHLSCSISDFYLKV